MIRKYPGKPFQIHESADYLPAKVCTAEFVREIFIRQNLSADRFFRSINGPLTLKKAFGKKVSMCPTSIRRPSYAGCLKQGWKRHFRG